MKKRLVQLAVTLAMLFMLLAGSGGGAAVLADDDPMPCDPPPTHWCEQKGGTFNYVTCRCEYPPK